MSSILIYIIIDRMTFAVAVQMGYFGLSDYFSMHVGQLLFLHNDSLWLRKMKKTNR